MNGGFPQVGSSLAASLAVGQSVADPAGLDLRAMDSGTRSEKIARIAVQFEQILIQTLLKTATMEEEKEDESAGMGITLDGTRDLRTLMLSQHVAESGGFGLAKVIQQQIEAAYAVPAASGATTAAKLPAAPTTSFNLSPNQLVRPVGTARISSSFGWRADPFTGDSRFHNGVDIAVASGTPVRSMDGGRVVFAGWKSGLGNTVEVRHASGLLTRYGHNSALKVQAGDVVEAGAVVALSGASGRSTGPHLHFEVWQGSVPQNPIEVLASGKTHVFAGNAELSVDKA